MATIPSKPWLVRRTFRTPYRALERRPVWHRPVFYACVLSMCILWLRWMRTWATEPESTLLQFEWMRLIFFMAPLLVPFLVAIPLLATTTLQRRIRRFEGRCLNCGRPRLSDFLDTCSHCGDDFEEQDAFRRLVNGEKPGLRDKCLECKTAVAADEMYCARCESKRRIQQKVFRRGLSGLNKPVPELERRIRMAWIGGVVPSLCVWIASIIAYVTIAFVRPELLSENPDTADFVLIGAILLGTLPMLPWCILAAEKQKQNRQRLTGRCLECEAKRDPLTDVCPACNCDYQFQDSHADRKCR